MKTTHRGFIVPLLLIIVAILLAGGGAYVYVQTKQASQSAVAASTTQATTTTFISVNSLVGFTGDNILTVMARVLNTDIQADTKWTINYSGAKYYDDWVEMPDPLRSSFSDWLKIHKGTLVADYNTGNSIGRFTISGILHSDGILYASSIGQCDPTDTACRKIPWKIYTNTSKGYSISYPVDAKIDTSNLSCVRIDTKEFGSVAINAGSSNPCGDPTGLGVGMISSEDTITIASKQYPTSGYRESDNGFSFFDFNSPISEKISVTYGVVHFDKSNPNNWKNLGALTYSEYQNALNSAKGIVSTFKTN